VRDEYVHEYTFANAHLYRDPDDDSDFHAYEHADEYD
jgi:hypothetical protein